MKKCSEGTIIFNLQRVMSEVLFHSNRLTSRGSEIFHANKIWCQIISKSGWTGQVMFDSKWPSMPSMNVCPVEVCFLHNYKLKICVLTTNIRMIYFPSISILTSTLVNFIEDFFQYDLLNLSAPSYVRIIKISKWQTIMPRQSLVKWST